LEAWLLQCAFIGKNVEQIPYDDLIRLPELFPFNIKIGLDYLRRNTPFSVYRAGGGDKHDRVIEQQNEGVIMRFSKGSEWRRWDLHIHTKDTLKEDNFKSESFEDFCIILFYKALESSIAAIGITDYFCVDNYKKIRQFVNEIDRIEIFTDEEKAQIRNILIIPNVELRLLPSTDSGRPINIHCLFNPEFVDSLENHFFGSLEHSGGNGTKFKMNRQGMIDLGRSTDPNLS
jgi:hypothetical protein